MGLLETQTSCPEGPGASRDRHTQGPEAPVDRGACMLAFAGCVGVCAQRNFGNRGNKREMKARRKPPGFWDTAQGSPPRPATCPWSPGPEQLPACVGRVPGALSAGFSVLTAPVCRQQTACCDYRGGRWWQPPHTPLMGPSVSPPQAAIEVKPVISHWPRVSESCLLRTRV